MARFRRRFFDPTGERYGTPTWPWGCAPEGLATRDQLVAQGLRPRGPAVGQIMWRTRSGVRVAYLYPVEAATPPRPRSPRQVAQLEEARRRRRTCPECGVIREYFLSTKWGVCTPCITTLGLAA